LGGQRIGARNGEKRKMRNIDIKKLSKMQDWGKSALTKVAKQKQERTRTGKSDTVGSGGPLKKKQKKKTKQTKQRAEGNGGGKRTFLKLSVGSF